MQVTEAKTKDLDASVAVEVMGWKTRVKGRGEIITLGDQACYFAPDDQETPHLLPADAPNYSTSWDAARHVVERMQELGFAVRICFYPSSNKSECVIFADRGAGMVHVSMAYDTPERAICLASLEAVRRQS